MGEESQATEELKVKSLVNDPCTAALSELPEGNGKQAGLATQQCFVSPRRATMPRWGWVLVLAILALGLYQRWHGLGAFPHPHQTNDEFHYVWVGLSLLHEGRPMAWSDLGAYDALGGDIFSVRWDGTSFRMVRPAMDHPPLFSLVAGAFARLTGARPVLAPDGEKPGCSAMIWSFDLTRTRLLTLVLYLASALFLFGLARQEFSFEAAALAVLFYSLDAHIVFHGRLLVTENLSTPLLLLNLWVLERWLAGRASHAAFATLTVVTVAAAMLCKLVAVVQGGAIVGLLLLAGRRREVVWPILGALVGGAIYLAYGWWQGWTFFWGILHAQGERFYGLNVLERFVIMPQLVHFVDFNFLILAGWLALFMLAFACRRKSLLLAPLFYLLGFIFFTAAPAIYGWHLLPFYPFLCLALGVVVHDVYRHCDPARFVVVTALLLPNAFHVIFLNQTDHAGAIRWVYLLATSAALGFGLARAGTMRQRVMRLTLTLAVAMTLIQEFWTVWLGRT